MQEKQLQFYYLGKPYPVKIDLDPSARKIDMEWDGKTLYCVCPESGEADISDALKSFYVKTGRKLIEKRLKRYQPMIKVNYRSFAIEDSRTKWGSCNSKRHLTFHWKLMLFPVEIIDYVIVHELCHLIHMNHDRSFWRLVGKIFPEYKEAMAVLGTEKTREM